MYNGTPLTIEKIPVFSGSRTLDAKSASQGLNYCATGAPHCRKTDADLPEVGLSGCCFASRIMPVRVSNCAACQDLSMIFFFCSVFSVSTTLTNLKTEKLICHTKVVGKSSNKINLRFCSNLF